MSEIPEEATFNRDLFVGVMQEIAEAVQPGCEGCSTAGFAPQRLGNMVVKDIITMEEAKELLSTCRGLTEEPYPFCHYKSTIDT